MRKFLSVLVVLILCVGLFGYEFLVEGQTTINPNDYRAPMLGEYNRTVEITRLDCAGHDPVELDDYPSAPEESYMFMDINIKGAGSTDEGTPIYSSSGGVVIISEDSGWPKGINIEIYDGKGVFRYLHLAKVYVQRLDVVERGELIGLMGNTGNSLGAHLHWEAFALSGYSLSALEIQGIDESGSCSNNSMGEISHQAFGDNPFQSCPDYYDQGYGYVTLFDHRDCRGHLMPIFNVGQIVDLSSLGFDNRTRSMYIPSGKSVLMGPINGDRNSINYCWNIDMWNTDVDHYFNASHQQTNIRIGWDSQFPSANNMISWVQVHNNHNCSGQGNNVNNTTVVSSIQENINTGGSNGQYGNSAVDIRDSASCQNGQYGWNGATNGIFNLSPDINYMEDKTSCIDVDYGFSIMVYKDANGQGANRCFNHTVSELQHAYLNDGTNANDVISSVQVFTNLDCNGQLSYGLADGDMITVWENGNYSGPSYGWHGAGVYNFSNFGASSIGVMQGWSALVYENANQGGAQNCIVSSDPYLTSETYYSGSMLEDNIESIQVFHDSVCGGWSPPTPVATATPIPFDGGLLTNGSFELGLGTGWSVDSTSIAVDTSIQGNHGLNTLRFATSATTAHAFSSMISVSNVYQYQWSTYVKTTAGSGEFGFAINEYDANYNAISFPWLGAIYSQFDNTQTYSYVPSSANVVYAELVYYLAGNSSFVVYIDSARVTQSLLPTSTPTATLTPTHTSTYTPVPTNTPTQAPPQNLVLNNSFEQLTSGWADNWNRSDATLIVVDTSMNGSTGTNSLHLLPNTGITRASTALMPVQYGSTYTWSFYVKTTNNTGEVGFYVDEFGANYNWISGQWIGNRFGNANEWVGYNNYTPSSASVAYVSLQYFHVENTALDSYIDSVSFIKN